MAFPFWLFSTQISYFTYFLSFINRKVFAFLIFHFDTFISIRNKVGLD